jgi:RNA polymerase sigma-70 factor (ECF subfamily)
LDLHQLYREHYRSLVRFLYRRIGDQARAEDLAQEAFVRAIEHHPEKPRPWLFAVASNLAKDEGRKSSVRRHHLTLIKGETKSQPAVPGPEVALERQETVRRVRTALAELRKRDREALLLWEEGLSYDEIAGILDLSRGSIGTTLSRARSRLAEAYERLESKGSDQDVAH